MNMNTPALGWTEERIETLKRLYHEDLSASQMAQMLGGGATRNAVIGKLHRLGLARGTHRPSARSSANARAARKVAKKPVAPKSPLLRTSPVVSPLKLEPFRPGAPIETIVDDIAGVPLVALTSHSCRWPVGLGMGARQMFCGTDIAEGKVIGKASYCREHELRSVAR